MVSDSGETRDIPDLDLENRVENPVSGREGPESLHDPVQSAPVVSSTVGAGPAKPKKDLSPAQIAHLEKMRKTREEKKAAPKAEPIIKVTSLPKRNSNFGRKNRCSKRTHRGRKCWTRE